MHISDPIGVPSAIGQQVSAHCSGGFCSDALRACLSLPALKTYEEARVAPPMARS